MYTLCTVLVFVGIAFAAPREKRQLVPANCNFQAPNPCSRTNKQVFYAHPNDNTKFIQCNALGEMYIIQCPGGKRYNAATTSCVTNSFIPGTGTINTGGTAVNIGTNPCTAANVARGQIYFSITGSKTNFIECDLNGNANVLTCPSLLVWDESKLSCVYVFQQGQPTPTPNTAVLPGTGVTTNPCKLGVAGSQSQFYSHPDPTKFIQCDLAGDAYILSCPAGLVWNEFSKTCVSPYTLATGVTG